MKNKKGMSKGKYEKMLAAATRMGRVLGKYTVMAYGDNPKVAVCRFMAMENLLMNAASELGCPSENRAQGYIADLRKAAGEAWRQLP